MLMKQPGVAKAPPDAIALLRDAFDDRELVEINGRKFVVNPLTEQIPATSAELLRAAADSVCRTCTMPRGIKIAGEEDKGGILVAAVALAANRPFGLARWYPSGLEGQIVVSFECEYAHGQLYLNGVERGDRVVIVDDLISTGGTMIALIKAIQNAGAEILDIVCVAEKVEYEGSRRVKETTGFDIKSLVKLSIAGKRSKVVALHPAL